MRYSPFPLPFAGTGEYIAVSASFEQVCQLPVKSQPAERNGRRLAPQCFSVIQPASATYCTPRKNSGAIIGSSSASLLQNQPALKK